MTVMIDLPFTVKGFTICNDGCYTIFLNKNLNHEQNKESYLHEMRHIINGDFDKKECNANMIELIAHKQGG